MLSASPKGRKGSGTLQEKGGLWGKGERTKGRSETGKKGGFYISF